MTVTVRSTKGEPGRLRMVVYGQGGVGKTTFAGSFPKPFFISVGSESGVNVLTQMEQECEYVLVTNRTEMEEACRYFKENYQKEGWLTCVIDTATIYGRILQMEQSNYGAYQIQHNGWLQVLGHFLNMREMIQTCDVHVVWVLHDDEAKNADGGLVEHVGPKLVGQALKEIMQTCDLVGHLTREEVAEKKDDKGTIIQAAQTVRRLWLRCPNNLSPSFTVKNRFEKVLTAYCYQPYFKNLMAHLAPTHITEGYRK